MLTAEPIDGQHRDRGHRLEDSPIDRRSRRDQYHWHNGAIMREDHQLAADLSISMDGEGQRYLLDYSLRPEECLAGLCDQAGDQLPYH
jgi:hypothetical protein